MFSVLEFNIMFRPSLISGLLGAATIAFLTQVPGAALAKDQYRVTAEKSYKTAKYEKKRGYKRGYHDGEYGHYHGALSRRAIRRILRHRGYHNFEFIDRRGDRYVAKAYDRRDRYVRVALDAYTGEIIRKRILYARGHDYHGGYLSVHKLRHRLAGQGFHSVHRIRMKRGHYYAHSYDRYGSPVLLTINAHNGRVLACDPIY